MVLHDINYNVKGLTQEQVVLSREKYGENKLEFKKENGFLDAVKGVLKEPMIILLFAASFIYFVSGKIGDGIFLSSAIILVSLISLYQNSRSRNALEKLKKYAQPFSKVIRNGKTIEIKSEEIVIGDSIVIEEGILIAADGDIIYSNDFSVNESILTGESLTVFKDKTKADYKVYYGTTVASGLAIVEVTAIGNSTKFGKIGKSLESINEEKTPLELQIKNFVKMMVTVGAIIFLLVWVINYFNSYQILDSLLMTLTLAMSIVPEEIPFAFTSFMALGAWRLMKIGIIVKQMKTVETLGSSTVICIDKTGTITENQMSLAKIFLLSTQKITSPHEKLTPEERELIKLAMWASEPFPFDPMEVALHRTYKDTTDKDERINYKLFYEYPLEGKPPMMTHIFESDIGERIVAAKGAPEAIIKVSNLSLKEKQHIEDAIKNLANDGYRILGVAESYHESNRFPKKQQELSFKFIGMVAFNDPPKKNINKVLEDFYKAGITVKIITGDNTETTMAIAKQIGFKGFEKSITGDELMKINNAALAKCVMNTNIFTRMFPEAKLKVVNALKAQNQIVAMTGDGVNDGPALKAAHIGIAMGKKGTEIAKQAASLILLEDDLSKMVEAVAMGRRIYSNLKKAIQYIISIHIPIILTIFIPLALGWVYPNIFSPLHVIFLELIMGPTCSIIFENEPIEKNSMTQNPRPFTKSFFKLKELTTSIIQGLIITAGTLFTYQYSIKNGYNEPLTRTMVFTVLIVANIFLTFVNRSFYYSVIKTLEIKNNLVFLIVSITIVILSLLLYIKPFTIFFDLEQLTIAQLLICIGIGFLSVIWYEVVKFTKRLTKELKLTKSTS